MKRRFAQVALLAWKDGLKGLSSVTFAGNPTKVIGVTFEGAANNTAENVVDSQTTNRILTDP